MARVEIGAEGRLGVEMGVVEGQDVWLGSKRVWVTWLGSKRVAKGRITWLGVKQAAGDQNLWLEGQKMWLWVNHTAGG